MKAARQDGVLRWAVEAGLLKRMRRTGWWCSGIRDPESVAEHSHRMALLAFYIAGEEGADACRAAALGVLHDLPETRIGDAHAVVKRYWTGLRGDEDRARREQNACLPPGRARDAVAAMGEEWSLGRTREALCARDADYLECAIQALEYLWREKNTAREWLRSNTRRLRTRCGKRLGRRLEELFEKGKWEDFRTWWKSIYVR
ncbi:MAG: HD domain-containing protein [Elusimicrobia bacterium]|nr:HD domain-containing protein [Elusimicrobiota bacterium]